MGARNCRLFTMFFVFLRLWANGQNDCPLKMEPSTVVVRYGDPVLVNCTVSGDHEGIGWEASEESVQMVTDSNVKVVTWRLKTLTDWKIRPRCFGNFLISAEPFQCDEKLNITVYKPPDSVSISAVNHTGPMLEGKQYQLQCEVQNIAPVQYLTVKWYKGETLENQTSYDDLTKTPVNVSSTLLITPTSADDGAQYSCVAELELGPEGPQPPPSNKSDPLNITVHYKPRITECPDYVNLKEGESLDTLVSCRAEGNPSPVVTWYRDQSEFNGSTQLTRRDAGLYVMTAKNTLGSVSVTFTVGYAPIFYGSINETLEVAEGQDIALNCSAVGNPLPEYSWSSPLNKEENTNETLITSLPPGTHVYTCNAKNNFGESRKYFTVKVLGIADYLPLIAGIVALAVVCISIAFAFIYCIYYKNTKMGEYNLKLGKSRTQNAHVAQNGRDSSLPMKKLTKPSLPV